MNKLEFRAKQYDSGMRALKNHFICCGYVFANKQNLNYRIFNREGGDLDNFLITEVIMYT